MIKIIPTKDASVSTKATVEEYGTLFNFLDCVAGFLILTAPKIRNLHFAIPVSEVRINDGDNHAKK